MSEPIRIVKTTQKKDKPKDKDLAFGNVFTDHMFVADFEEEKGWYDPRVEPYGPFPLDPATAVLHYGQSLFEGLKGFRGQDGKIRLFRPDKHVTRLNRTAAAHAHPGHRSRAHLEVVDDAGRRGPRLGALVGGHLALHPADGDRQRGVPRRAAGARSISTT